MSQHWHSGDFVQHLRGFGFHAGALACGENHDSQFAQSAS
jgi:hypothetical protein